MFHDGRVEMERSQFHLDKRPRDIRKRTKTKKNDPSPMAPFDRRMRPNSKSVIYLF